MVVVSIAIAILILVCSFQALRSRRLLTCALWLAVTSAAVSVLMYMLGAAEVAVIELSVGAGLVTVLFVFAINIAGEEPIPTRTLVPRPVAWALVIASVGLVTWFGRHALSGARAELVQTERFATVLWNQRGLDLLLQIVLIFAGVLGVLGLLADAKPHAREEKRS